MMGGREQGSAPIRPVALPDIHGAQRKEGCMRKIVILTGVIALSAFVALIHVDRASARTPDGGDATGPNGGAPGGRWYSYGTVAQTVWVDSYEFSWAPWPLPGRYELKVVKRSQTSFYLREVCSYDPRIWECSPGAERLTFQFTAG